MALWSVSLPSKPQAALHCGRHFGSQDKKDKHGRILPDPQMPGQKPGEATIKTHHLSPPSVEEQSSFLGVRNNSVLFFSPPKTWCWRKYSLF